MKQKFFYVPLLFLSLALLPGCSSDDDTAPPDLPGGKSEISFSIGFSGEGDPMLKVATDKDFKTTWEPGDEIGLFAVKGSGSLLASGNYVHNMKLTRQSDDTWQAANAMYYPNDGDDLHFYAYYPYDAAMTDPTSYTFGVRADQNGQTSGKSNYNLSDLLLAKAVNQSKGSTVNLTFSHALSLVQVEVKREVNVPHFDGDFTVTLTNALPDAALNWSGNLTGTGTPTDIVMHKVADATGYTYRALVPAQALAADSKVSFVQTTPGKEIDMEYQGVKNTTLTAKNAHKYSVTLGYGIDPDHAYAVGDKYPHTGPAIGIVFYIESGSDGKHGKIVGLKEVTGKKWDDGYYSTGANNTVNGRANMQTIADYISSQSKSWSNFPAFEWVHNLNGAGQTYTDANATGVWYLPSIGELQYLYCAWNGKAPETWYFSGSNNPGSNYPGFTGDLSARTNFNTKIQDAFGTVLGNNYYWSSSESVNYRAFEVYFSDGFTGPSGKNNYNGVRCVLAF